MSKRFCDFYGEGAMIIENLISFDEKRTVTEVQIRIDMKVKNEWKSGEMMKKIEWVSVCQ